MEKLLDIRKEGELEGGLGRDRICHRRRKRGGSRGRRGQMRRRRTVIAVKLSVSLFSSFRWSHPSPVEVVD